MFSIKKYIKKIVESLPLYFQKKIYLAWHYFNNPFLAVSLSRSVKTYGLDLTEEDKKVRVIGFLKIHNEMSFGNLERVLKHLKEICNEIVVCDCESTDGSAEFAKKYTEHVLYEKNDFQHEMKVKQTMLDYTISLNPDWIFWLDADEVVERIGEMGGIRKLCVLGDKEKIDAFEFPEINLWKDTKHYRDDEFWAKGLFVRLWKNNGKLKFETATGLHKQQHPVGLNNIQKSDLSVIHYGFSSPEIIQQKYERYKANGQSGFALERISPSSDKGVVLKELNIDLIPLSALKVVVVALIYRSTGYADFVYKSFLKHSEGAEFLFIANDATPKIKQYLSEKNIPHLIFDNENKEEYYLNRVYRAWNYGGMNAPGDVIVFVNSDMAFTKGWLTNLLKNITKNRIVCSRLVESGKLLSGQYAIAKNFGQTYNEFSETEFTEYAES
ncbi:glycosyltransferase family 2 protein, partial [Candidatus Nomurabacteria bacterium]|nr:glycosyltransferase family 2 protein [Candidatus Nomurabacteria bacterium]